MIFDRLQHYARATALFCLQKLHVFRDKRNRFLHCWNFANRIPYDKGSEVEILFDCLEELHGVVSILLYNVKSCSQ